MQFPVLVTRSITRIKGDKLSRTFTATFADGSQKCIRESFKDRGVITEGEIGNEPEVLDKDYCPLYYRDWSVFKNQLIKIS